MTTKVKGTVFSLIEYGVGSPEAVLVGNPGDLYVNTDGGAGITLYVKETGVATDTGWVAK